MGATCGGRIHGFEDAWWAAVHLLDRLQEPYAVRGELCCCELKSAVLFARGDGRPPRQLSPY